MKKITLQDIANELGITKGTVDRALHNRQGISPETRRKVLELIEKYEYKPDRIARSLSLKARKIRIGAIYQTIPGFFWDRVKDGIRQAETEYTDFGLEVIYRELKKKARDEDEITARMDELIRDKVDGIVLVPVNSTGVREKIYEAIDRGISVATLNDDITGSGRKFYVGPQMRQSGRMAAEMICKFLKGAGKVLTINASMESLEYCERLEGFNEVISERPGSINIVANYTFNNEMMTEKGGCTIRRILENTGDLNAIYDIDGASLYDVGCILRESEKLRDVILIGHEVSDGVKELLNDGTLHACISQDPFSQGFYIMKLLYEYLLDGAEPESERMYTRLDVIMKENMKAGSNIINTVARTV